MITSMCPKFIHHFIFTTIGRFLGMAIFLKHVIFEKFGPKIVFFTFLCSILLNVKWDLSGSIGAMTFLSECYILDTLGSRRRITSNNIKYLKILARSDRFNEFHYRGYGLKGLMPQNYESARRCLRETNYDLCFHAGECHLWNTCQHKMNPINLVM